MRLDYSQIPPLTLETLQAWVEYARPVGSFCEALLCNDLSEAFARADDDNIRAMFHTVGWLYNEAPSACWGSEEKYEAWAQTYGTRGKK